MATVNWSDWRCRQCNRLLAHEADSQIYLKIRRLQYLVRGREFTVITACHHCLALNEITAGTEVRTRASVMAET